MSFVASDPCFSSIPDLAGIEDYNMGLPFDLFPPTSEAQARPSVDASTVSNGSTQPTCQTQLNGQGTNDRGRSVQLLGELHAQLDKDPLQVEGLLACVAQGNDLLAGSLADTTPSLHAYMIIAQAMLMLEALERVVKVDPTTVSQNAFPSLKLFRLAPDDLISIRDTICARQLHYLDDTMDVIIELSRVRHNDAGPCVVRESALRIKREVNGLLVKRIP
jgi:hypothetical protein